jgi:hypothetical protein
MFISIFMVHGPQAIALTACPMSTVKRKKPGIQCRKPQTADRANTPETEDLFFTIGSYNQEAAFPFSQGLFHNLVEVLGWKSSYHDFNGMFMVST